MSYTITKGEEKETGDIQMEPCKNFKVFHTHHDKSKDVVMQKHVDAKQFFCPVLRNLEIWGEVTDMHSKILSVTISKCDPSKLK